MRIAQVAPLFEAVPPKLYGGTERVVFWLTEELVKAGHEVTLFASGDSRTSARLVPCAPEALRLCGTKDTLAPHVLQVERVAQMATEFDIIHFHIDYLHLPLFRRLGVPYVTTLHGRLDLPEMFPFYKEFKDSPFVSISYAQRRPLPFLNWVATVYHGLPRDLYKPVYEPGKYLAFLGRISPEKRPDRAIELAERVGVKLVIAAKVDRADEEYFKEVIKPKLKSPWVEFVGEIGEKEKQEFLGGAMALLMLIDWPEPFGIVMIEANACGTPVIAWNCGSVPEIIEDGVNGFVVNDMDEAAEAVERLGEIKREDCRRRFEEYFTSERMARDYLEVYERLQAREVPLWRKAA